MDWIVWATQMPQMCCILPTVLLICLAVVSFGIDLLLFPLKVVLALLGWKE